MKSLVSITRILSLILVIIFVVQCNGSPPTPDLIATQAAIEKATAATLTAEAAVTPQAATPTPSFTPTEPGPTDPPPTVTPTLATPDNNGASQPTPTNTAEATPEPMCVVVPASLNLRSGPGVAYEPPLATITQGTVLKPIGFSATGYPGGQWVQVQTPDNLTGWVITDPQFITCNIDLSALPPVSVPPPPTPTSTPTLVPAQPTPTPTPTPELFVVLEPPGGGNDNIDGYVVFPGYTEEQLNPNDVVFRNQMTFRVIAYDIRRGLTDGAGIENIQFEITNSQGVIVHEHTEQTAGYCVFGGGEPNCNVWVFAQHNYRWPEPFGDQRIENDDYTVRITIQPRNGDTANWNFPFRIEGAPTNEPSDLTAEIVQTGPNSDADVVSDALVFQVFASADGQNDGAGIDRVDMRIIGPNGEVYQRTEQSAAYCAFSGGEPDCNVWVFAEHNNRWPNDDPIEPGDYALRATIYAEDGSRITIEKTIEIQ